MRLRLRHIFLTAALMGWPLRLAESDRPIRNAPAPAEWSAERGLSEIDPFEQQLARALAEPDVMQATLTQPSIQSEPQLIALGLFPTSRIDQIGDLPRWRGDAHERSSNSADAAVRAMSIDPGPFIAPERTIGGSLTSGSLAPTRALDADAGTGSSIGISRRPAYQAILTIPPLVTAVPEAEPLVTLIALTSLSRLARLSRRAAAV